MAGTLNKLAVLFISSSIFVLSGCTVRTVHDHHHHGYGPPPHAPHMVIVRSIMNMIWSMIPVSVSML